KPDERLRVDASPTRCPYCKDVLSDVKDLVACARCGARHHESCHREHGSCATCGSTETLVHRSVARARRESPPLGSKIEVARQGEETTYTWGVSTWAQAPF